MDRIRFRCACGRKMVAPAKYAGRRAKCPGCAKPIVVPKKSQPKAEPAPPKPGATRPKSDTEIFKAIVGGLGAAVASHYGSSDGYFVKLKLASGRQQGLMLRRGAGNELTIASEIGMLAGHEHGIEALKMAADLPGIRLFANPYNLLSASVSVPLPWTDAGPFLRAAETLAAGADKIEEKLFGLDLR